MEYVQPDKMKFGKKKKVETALTNNALSTSAQSYWDN